MALIMDLALSLRALNRACNDEFLVVVTLPAEHGHYFEWLLLKIGQCNKL